MVEREVTFVIDGVDTKFRVKRPSYKERMQESKVSGLRIDPSTMKPASSATEQEMYKFMLERARHAIIEPKEYRSVERLETLPDDIIDHINLIVNELSSLSPSPLGGSKPPQEGQQQEE